MYAIRSYYALLRAGELDEAQRIYAGFSPADRNALVTALGAELAMARKQWPEADAILTRAIKQYPADTYLVYRLADTRIQSGQVDQAVTLLKQALTERRDRNNFV